MKRRTRQAKKQRHAATLAASVLGMLMAPAAYAQSIPEEDVLEEIVITGIRSSIRQSLADKREAGSLVDTINQQDIGKFPDLNVADSLRRIPGVTIERSVATGEASTVSIRGFGSDQNLTLINGQNLASPSGSRAFNFEILPSDLVGSIKVYKSPEADLDEGGAGGTIVINTRKPLDEDGNYFAATVQARQEDAADETGSRYSLVGSWSDSDSRFGILGAVSVTEFDKRNDFIETFEWGTRDIDVGNDGIVEFTDVRAPNNVNFSTLIQEVENIGANIGLQFRATDNIEFGANVLYASRDRKGGNQNFRFQQNYADIISADVQDGILVAGQFGESTAGSPGNEALWGSDLILDAGTSDLEIETLAVDASVEWVTGDWTGRAVIGLSDGQTSPQGQGQLFAAFGQNTGGTNFRLAGDALLGGASDPSTIDLNSLPLFWAQAQRIRSDDEENHFQLDFDKNFDSGAFSSIEFGVKIRARENSAVRDDGFAVNNGNVATPLGPVYADVQTENLSGYPTGLGSQPEYPVNRPTADFLGLFGPLGVSYPEGLGFLNNTPDVVEEDILAFYGKLNIESSIGSTPIRGNIGVRVVETKTDSTSNTTLGVITTSGDYRDILPSMNLVFELSDDLLLRTAYSKVMARPNFQDLRGTLDLNTVAGIGSAGNPDLEPFRADAIDVALEWYFADGAIASAAFFYKDIESFLTSSTAREDFEDVQAGCCIVTRPANGGPGEVTGLELGLVSDFNFLSGIGQNFGGEINYTYSDSTSEDLITGESTQLPGQSKNSVAASLFYEDERFSARLAYTWRDEFLGGAVSGVVSQNSDVSRLDASFAVNITDRLTARIEAANLTEEANVERFIGVNGHNLPIFYANDGRQFYLSLSYVHD